MVFTGFGVVFTGFGVVFTGSGVVLPGFAAVLPGFRMLIPFKALLVSDVLSGKCPVLEWFLLFENGGRPVFAGLFRF